MPKEIAKDSPAEIANRDFAFDKIQRPAVRADEQIDKAHVRPRQEGQESPAHATFAGAERISFAAISRESRGKSAVRRGYGSKHVSGLRILSFGLKSFRITKSRSPHRQKASTGLALFWFSNFFMSASIVPSFLQQP